MTIDTRSGNDSSIFDPVAVTSDWRCQSPGCESSTAHLSHGGPPGKRCDVCDLKNWVRIVEPIPPTTVAKDEVALEERVEDRCEARRIENE